MNCQVAGTEAPRYQTTFVRRLGSSQKETSCFQAWRPASRLCTPRHCHQFSSPRGPRVGDQSPEPRIGLLTVVRENPKRPGERTPLLRCCYRFLRCSRNLAMSPWPAGWFERFSQYLGMQRDWVPHHNVHRAVSALVPTLRERLQTTNQHNLNLLLELVNRLSIHSCPIGWSDITNERILRYHQSQ